LKDKERDFKNVREKIESDKDNINKEIIKVNSYSDLFHLIQGSQLN